MRNKIVSIIFIVAITAVMFINIISGSIDISYSERRLLYTFSDIEFDDDFSENFEKYALDQFMQRDLFRKIKGLFDSNVFKKLDNNGLYLINDMLFKSEYPLNEKSVSDLGEKINKIYDLYLNDSNHVYYSIIPDKNYYISDDIYLTIDYEKMETIMNSKIASNLSYISLFSSLTLEDYYKTDHHWKQDSLANVIKTLSEHMEFNNNFDSSQYEHNQYGPFYGAYYGQSAVTIAPDELVYLENEFLSKTKVTIFKDFTTTEVKNGVYDKEQLGSIDSYNMFLYGSVPIKTLENELVDNSKELIIFSDSFTNSLAPLLMDGYSKITLIDLRLVHHEVLDRLIDFSNSDVLFLYSTLVINHSEILK